MKGRLANATPAERARLRAIEKEAGAFVRKLLQAPEPRRSILIAALEASQHPDPFRRQFDRYAGALARRLLNAPEGKTA